MNISRYPCDTFGSSIDWVLMKFNTSEMADFCDRRFMMECDDVYEYTVPCFDGNAVVHVWLNEYKIFGQKPKQALYPECLPPGSPNCNAFGWNYYSYSIPCDECDAGPDRMRSLLAGARDQDASLYGLKSLVDSSVRSVLDWDRRTVTLTDEVEPDCDEDIVREITVDKCSLSPDRVPIKVITRNSSAVTFQVQEIWRDCTKGNGREPGWFAADYISASTGELMCEKTDDLTCGASVTHIAQCKKDMAVVDLYVYDGVNGMFAQNDGSSLAIPESCKSSGVATKTCHFRYLLSCVPKCNLATTKTKSLR